MRWLRSLGWTTCWTGRRPADRIAPRVWAAAGLAGSLVLGGCGMPGAPLPPSLNLPDQVTDLSSVRAGNQVSLAWTMPKRNTDKLLLKGDVQARVCRREKDASPCAAVANLGFPPGAEAAFTETLPAALTVGTPRAITYFVELVNRKGRSAGLSNGAAVAAGEAPATVTGLSAEMRRDGVLLRWTPVATGSAAIRLQRTLLTPPGLSRTKPERSPVAPLPEPRERTLLVPVSAREGMALDKDIRFGEDYAYRAQRVASVSCGGRTLELAGAFSAEVRIDTKNVFPPAVPTGLAAVATVGENGATAIDLSWQPDTEADLAGYLVYRREADGAWRRISPAQPVVGPGYHDPDVQSGHTYFYAVSAIDQEGHESARSAEAQETVPGP